MNVSKIQMRDCYNDIIQNMQSNVEKYVQETQSCANHKNQKGVQCPKCLNRAADYLIKNALTALFILKNAEFLFDQINNVYHLYDAAIQTYEKKPCDNTCKNDNCLLAAKQMRTEYLNIMSKLLKNKYLNTKQFAFYNEQV